MYDDYVEQIVPARATGKQRLPLVGAWVLLCAGISVTFFVTMGWGFLIMGIGIACVVWTTRNQKIEYEYTFTNGDLDVAEIRNKTTRKEVFRFGTTEVQQILPYESDEFTGKLSSSRNITVVDYTSCNEACSKDWYAFLINGGAMAVILELNERSLEHVKNAYKKIMK